MNGVVLYNHSVQDTKTWDDLGTNVLSELCAKGDRREQKLHELYPNPPPEL